MTVVEMDERQKRVEFAARMDWRSYVPELRWYWWDSDEGCLSFTVGNRNCDPLLQLELTLHRVPWWLGGRAGEMRSDAEGD